VETYTSDTIRNHKIMVGTPYTFQGQEKDVILISLSLDADSHPSAFHYLNNENMLNVGITRARHEQVIYYSFDPATLPPKHLIRRWFENEKVSRKKWLDVAKEKDEFSQEVIAFLTQQQVEVYPRFQYSSLDVDLLIKTQSGFVGIDLVGYPGDLQEAFSLERYSILSRAGFKTFPLPYSYWQLNREQCEGALLELL